MPYQHNLAAIRTVLDAQSETVRTSNLYLDWLACLRELSAPTTSAIYPEAMRTRAWAMKTLNTQLASWTELRHDTMLYAKQSYTLGKGACLYPTGFVEPRPEFWAHLRAMAERTAERLAGVNYSGTYPLPGWLPAVIDPLTGLELEPGRWVTNQVPLVEFQQRQVDHLRQFATTVRRLETLVAKELARTCFSAEDERFLDQLIEAHDHGAGCQGWTSYSGWYPDLFYRAAHWSDSSFDVHFGAGGDVSLVADVHTDVPDAVELDPGSVLHEAVGGVSLLFLAVENGDDHFLCAGPVLNHYEFEVIGSPRRLDDDEWNGVLQQQFPPDVKASRFEGLLPPPWTQAYLRP